MEIKPDKHGTYTFNVSTGQEMKATRAAFNEFVVGKLAVGEEISPHIMTTAYELEGEANKFSARGLDLKEKTVEMLDEYRQVLDIFDDSTLSAMQTIAGRAPVPYEAMRAIRERRVLGTEAGKLAMELEKKINAINMKPLIDDFSEQALEQEIRDLFEQS